MERERIVLLSYGHYLIHTAAHRHLREGHGVRWQWYRLLHHLRTLAAVVPLDVGNPRLCFLKCKEFVNGVAPEQVGLIARAQALYNISVGRHRRRSPCCGPRYEHMVISFDGICSGLDAVERGGHSSSSGSWGGPTLRISRPRLYSLRPSFAPRTCC